MTIDFNALYNTLKTGIIGIGQTQLNAYLPQVEADGQSMADAMKANLETWTTQLTTGALSSTDLAFLIQSSTDLLKVAALTQAGVAAVQLDTFKQSVTSFVVNTLLGAIKI